MTHLRKLREASGLSLREVARRIGVEPSNVSYWETSGNLPRSNVLLPMAKALGVSVEEILGEPERPGAVKPGGRLGDIVEQISRMPRRQRERVVGIVETVIAGEEARS